MGALNVVYQGHIEKGLVVLDEPVELPDGVRVRVELLAAEDEEEVADPLTRFTGIWPSNVDYSALYHVSRRND